MTASIETIRAALAPTGKLRAVINLGNSLLASLDADGAPVGVSVDLSKALAKSLECPITFVVVDAANKAVTAVREEQADVGFFAIDPLRGEGICFTAPYLLMEGAYLVSQGSAYDLFLTRTLKSAEILRDAKALTVVDVFAKGGYEVAAGVKQQLEAGAIANPGHRLLPGRFMVIEQAMGLPATRPSEAIEYLSAFIENAKSSGKVADYLVHHNIKGASVAPVL
jgi:polar amino acid transport system substrate-binding protein